MKIKLILLAIGILGSLNIFSNDYKREEIPQIIKKAYNCSSLMQNKTYLDNLAMYIQVFSENEFKVKLDEFIDEHLTCGCMSSAKLKNFEKNFKDTLDKVKIEVKRRQQLAKHAVKLDKLDDLSSILPYIIIDARFGKSQKTLAHIAVKHLANNSLNLLFSQCNHLLVTLTDRHGDTPLFQLLETCADEKNSEAASQILKTFHNNGCILAECLNSRGRNILTEALNQERFALARVIANEDREIMYKLDDTFSTGLLQYRLLRRNGIHFLPKDHEKLYNRQYEAHLQNVVSALQDTASRLKRKNTKLASDVKSLKSKIKELKSEGYYSSDDTHMMMTCAIATMAASNCNTSCNTSCGGC